MSSSKRGKNAPLLSKDRFEPDTIAVMIGLAVASLLLYAYGLKFFAIPPAIGVLSLFVVNSLEIIQTGHPDNSHPVGKKCLVVRRVMGNHRGIVKVYFDDSHLGSETWSAESTRSEVIEEGRTAKVVGMKSIILLVENEIQT